MVWDKDYPLLITTYSSHYMRSIAVVKKYLTTFVYACLYF
nr:MAG TPA: hypothetical protein [Caudoviricetes sp.]